MLFTSDVEWAVLKMVYTELNIRLQRLTKVSDTLRSTGRKYLKRILKYLCYTKCNKIAMCHSNMQKHVYYEKWFKQHRYF